MQKVWRSGIGMFCLLLWSYLPCEATFGTFSVNKTAASLTPGSVSPTSDTVCAYGDPAVFTSQAPTGGSGPILYQWQIQPGCTGPWTDIPGAITLSYDPPSGITSTTCYRLALTDNLCTVYSDTVQTVVRPGPSASLSPDGLPVTCQGDSVLFIATGGGSYSWIYNNQPFAHTNDSLFAAQTGDYTVIVTDAFGCSDTSQTYAMTWYPPLTVSISSTFTEICPGDSLLISSQVVGSATAFQWILDGIPIPGATQPAHASVSPGDYQLQVTDANGCTYFSSTLTMSPGTAPVATIDQPQDSLICAGQNIPLNGHGIGSYQWLLNGQPIPGATDSTHEAIQGGNYQLVVQNGCGADTSTGIQMQASPGPTAAFDYENYSQNEVLFIDESVNAVAWQWNLGFILSPEQNIYYGFPGAGSYPVTLVVWDSLGCTDSLLIAVTVTDPEFFVPNVFTPNGDGINDVARTRFDHLESIDFSIFDRWGNKIFISNSTGVYWDGKIGDNPAPEGVYFYVFKALDNRGEVISMSGNLTLLR
jgi:gliding motility-associated-like protein